MTTQQHILLVEDSPTQALRMQLELERHGFATTIANTGPRGLLLAQRTQPDVIVLDVELPGMDGYSICRALKANPATAEIPIIMLTKLDAAHDTLIGLQLGAADYIPKDDFAEQNLIAALQHLGIIQKG